MAVFRLAMVLLCGCATDASWPYDGVTPVYGIQVSGSADYDDIDYIAGETLAEFGLEGFGFTISLGFKGLGEVSGRAYAASHTVYRVEVEPRDCLAHSSLAHEFVHVVLDGISGWPDPGHLDPAWKNELQRVKSRTALALCQNRSL